MLKSLWQRWSVLLIVIAIALSGCHQIISSTSTTTKNQLVSTILSDSKTFNPALNNESPNVFGYVDEGLTTENGKGEIEPALAESW